VTATKDAAPGRHIAGEQIILLLGSLAIGSQASTTSRTESRGAGTRPRARDGGEGVRSMWPPEESAARIYDAANWGLVAGLVVGVISTVLVVWMGNVKEAYLRSHVAETNERAAHAEDRAAANEREAARLGKLAEDERLARVELESKVAWRRLGAKEQSQIASHLKQFSGEPALIAHSPNDIEAATFATEIATALQMAGWKVPEPLEILSLREGPVPLGTNPPLPTGVRVWSTGDETGRKAALAVVGELTSRGFDAAVSKDISSLLGIHPTPTRVVLSVEHKPEGAQGEYKLRRVGSSKQ